MHRVLLILFFSGMIFPTLQSQIQWVQWSTYRPENSELPDPMVTCLVKGPGDTLWIGTAGGLAWIRDSVIHAVQGTELFFIRNIRFNAAGEMYLATGGQGLRKRTSTGFVTIGNGALQLTDPYVNDCAFDNEGLWVATETEGLFRFDGVQWYNFDALTTQNQFPVQKIRHIYADGQGNRWLATGSKGLYNFKSGGQLYYFNVDSGLPSNVMTLIVPEGNRLWLGFGDNQSNNNLAWFVPTSSQYKVFTPTNADNIIFRQTTAVLPHSNGKYYIASNAIDAEGLVILEDTVFSRFQVAVGAEFISFVNALAEADSDKVYAGHVSGLSINRFIDGLDLGVAGPEISEDPLLPYPNPCTEVLHLKYSDKMEQCWLITDLHGRVAANGTGETANLRNLPSGVWLVRTGRGMFTRWYKFVKTDWP